MNKLKQILNAMKLHTAETHPLVETERAMELIEAELAEPQTMRPAELAERLKRGEKWAMGQERQPLTDAHVELIAQWLETQMTDTPTTGPQLAGALRYVGVAGIKEQP